MIASFARLTAERLRYPTVRDHGRDVSDYDATPAITPLTGLWLEPTQSSEDNDGQLGVLTGYTVLGPAGVDVDATDRIRYQGVTYEVVGDVQQITSPTGALNSTQFTIRRWEV